MIPKTAKLIKEEIASNAKVNIDEPKACTKAKKCDDDACYQEIVIREIRCLNDFVAILRFEEESVIEIPDNQRLKNEGMVIGVGPGVPPTTTAHVIIGDVVAFLPRNIVTEIKGTKYPYEGKTITIVSERNIIMTLDPIIHRFV